MKKETNVRRVATTSAKECYSMGNMDVVVGMEPRWQHGKAHPGGGHDDMSWRFTSMGMDICTYGGYTQALKAYVGMVAWSWIDPYILIHMHECNMPGTCRDNTRAS